MYRIDICSNNNTNNSNSKKKFEINDVEDRRNDKSETRRE